MSNVSSEFKTKSDRLILRLANNSGGPEIIAHVTIQADNGRTLDVLRDTVLGSEMEVDVTETLCDFLSSDQLSDSDLLSLEVWVWGSRTQVHGSERHGLKRSVL